MIARNIRSTDVAILTACDIRMKTGWHFGAKKRAAIKVVAGFGRDWSRGIRDTALCVSPQDVFPAEQQKELQVA